MGGGFPVDLVLFGLVAAFLVLRLMSILGKRTGFERPVEPSMAAPLRPAPARDQGPVIDATAQKVGWTLPDPASPIGQTLAAMARVDRSFDPQRFLDGAEAAFRIIVAAYAAGDRDRLKGLLAPETYGAFESAITGRESAREHQQTEIRSVQMVAIEHADLSGTVATIVVRFVSDQVNQTLAEDGSVVAGTDAVTEITDVWSFERDLATSDPAWRLVAARSA